MHSTNKFYVPRNLDMDGMTDKHLYIIDRLYTAKFLDKRYSDTMNLGWSGDVSILPNYNYCNLDEIDKKKIKREYIPLSSKHLRTILGTRMAKDILDDLQSEKVIETDNQYFVGSKSKGFRLSSQFHHVNFKTVSITDKRFKRTLERIREKEYESLSPLHKKMFEMIQSDFTYDFESAYKFLTKDFLDYKHINTVAFQLYTLKENNFYFSTDNKTGRVFTNYTNMKKEFRSFLRDRENKKLVELDIRNSQPLFLASLYNQHSNTSNSFYSKLCQDGILYDYLEKKIGDSRENVKKQFLTILFAPSHWKNKIKSVFESDFPEVLRFSNSIKENGNNKLALELQSCESNLVLSTTGSQLIQENIPFISIHDSLMICKSQSEYVRNLMTNNFQRLYNVTPIINYK